LSDLVGGADPSIPADPDLNLLVESLLDHVLASLDLHTRVGLLTGGEYWRSRPVSEIGLRPIVLSDGAAGVRGEGWDGADPSVCFPSPAAMGTTWDEALVGRLGDVVGMEARRKGVDVVLAPTVNLQRSPLAGRHFEYLAEDPLLVARLASAYVTGVQRHGVAATAKHYVANDSETNRFTVDVRVDEQTLREVYLPPFEELVTAAGVWVVMAAYNRVNGVTMTESPLLDEPLFGEWGFDGVVVSDWYAARSTEASARGGLSLVMPGPEGPWGPALLSAAAAGRVGEPAIADKVRRILRLAHRVGALTPRQAGSFRVAPDRPSANGSRHAVLTLLREASAASIVLASNAGLLPLNAASVRRLALLGANAADVTMQGGGTSEVVPEYHVSALDALRDAVGNQVLIEHAIGAPIRQGLSPLGPELAYCVSCGQRGVHVRYLDAAGHEIRSEHRRDGRLIWFGHQLPAGATVEVTTRLETHTPGTWRIGLAGVGESRLMLGAQLVVDETMYPTRPSFASSFLDPPQRWVDRALGEGGTLDVRLSHKPERDLDFVKLVLGARVPQAGPEAELSRAVAVAARSDVAVVVVGTNEEIETEGRDRTSIVLPGRQDELVSRVAQVNPRTVVVVVSGAPVAVPWRDDVSAVLLAPFGGQEFGHALADVLFGIQEPGGRLATTWGVADEDVPVLSTRPTDGVMPYQEASTSATGRGARQVDSRRTGSAMASATRTGATRGLTPRLRLRPDKMRPSGCG
jgi:beta-glucosidase